MDHLGELVDDRWCAQLPDRGHVQRDRPARPCSARGSPAASQHSALVVDAGRHRPQEAAVTDARRRRADEMLEPGRTDDVVFAERCRARVDDRLPARGRAGARGAGPGRLLRREPRTAPCTPPSATSPRKAGSREPRQPRRRRGDDRVVQSRFAAVLSRLVAAEQGVWRTGQAGVILGDLMRLRHRRATWTHAATVLRAARQRWLLERPDHRPADGRQARASTPTWPAT